MWHGCARSPASGISREVAFPARPQTDGSSPAASLRNRAASRPPQRWRDEDSGTTDADQMAVRESAPHVRKPVLQSPNLPESRSSAFSRNTEFLSLPFPCTWNEFPATPPMRLQQPLDTASYGPRQHRQQKEKTLPQIRTGRHMMKTMGENGAGAISGMTNAAFEKLHSLGRCL